MVAMQSNLYGNYRQRTFSEIFPNVDKFVDEFMASPFSSAINDHSRRILYYMLYANYGNSPISNSDENQFKYRVWSTIFMYGPTWEKRLEIQDKLRKLSEDELMRGGKAIYNHAFNPGTEPTTGSLEELDYINDQNTTNYKKSKLEGYAILMELLKTDVSRDFINKFKSLFLKFVQPEYPLWYVDNNDESEVLEI